MKWHNHKLTSNQVGLKYGFRSGLEIAISKELDLNKVKYEFETIKLKYTVPEKVHTYTPDFYLEKEDLYVELKAGRRDKKYSKNLECVQLVKNIGYNIKVIYMSEFYDMLKKENLYEEIPNIERRNYKKSRHLIRNWRN